jgi:hypothetical protein
MSVSADVIQLSNEIVALASDILQMAQSLKNRETRDFVNAKPQQRQPIIEALELTEADVADLLASSGDTQMATGTGARHQQVWEYDTASATIEDLTQRRDLLRNRKRVLEYLRVH